jgi:hypothetical protein
MQAFDARWPHACRAGSVGIRKKRMYVTAVTAAKSTAAHSTRRTRYRNIALGP